MTSTPNTAAQKTDYQLPAWLEPYQRGSRVGRSAALLAYSDYYCVDGAADEAPEIEERIPVGRTKMIPYASRTGTRQNLAAMRANGWHLLVSASGVLRTEGMPYALDNGAWSAFIQGRPFDELAFDKAFSLLGENAEWVVLPDIVAGGLRSLEFSLLWLERLRSSPAPLLLAVQDGMTPDDVREYLSPAVGIFVGGTTEWKLKTLHSWGILARRRCCHLHVGRVNSAKRILLCAAAGGAHSVDGTSASMYAKTIGPLSEAVRHTEIQTDFLSPNGQDFDATDYDCAWPSDL